MAWVLLEDTKETQSGKLVDGILDKEFLATLQQVVAYKGFVVSFQGLDDFSWVWDHGHEDDHSFQQNWKTVLKCNLGSFPRHLLVDDDLYKPYSLDELKTVLYTPNEISSRDQSCRDELHSSAAWVGWCFHWFFDRFDQDLLIDQYTPPPLTSPPRVNKLLRSKVGFRFGDHQRVSDRDWTVISGPPSGVLQGIKYVVVDVETHDWDRGVRNKTRDNFIGRIVEIAWLAFDGNGKELERKNCLLRPHGYAKISPKARAFHGITTKIARERGSNAQDVFAHFVHTIQQIPADDGLVIAHNMLHEDAAMATNLGPEGLRVWNAVPKCCTLNPLLLPVLFGPKYAGRKYGVNLSTLHEHCKPEKRRLRCGAHGALVDVMMTWDVFYHMLCEMMKKNIDPLQQMRWPARSFSHPAKRPRIAEAVQVTPDKNSF